MPRFSPEQITRALQSAGFRRGASPEDIANAEKYGLGIFGQTASRMRAPSGAPQQPLDPVMEAEGAYRTAGEDFKKRLLASGFVRDELGRMSNQDPTVSELRNARSAAQQKLGTLFTDTNEELQGVSDPFARERIRAGRSTQLTSELQGIGGRLQEAGATRESLIDRLAGLYGATTEAAKFDVGSKESALGRAIQAKQAAEARALETRFDDLKRREMEATIGAANRSNRGGGGGAAGLTFLQGLTNPLAAFLAAGGRRDPSPDGGFNFFDPKGNPITVEQAASLAPGGTVADFLGGSRMSQDQAIIQQSSGKPATQGAKNADNNAQSGLRSLDKIEGLYNDTAQRQRTVGFSRLPFGGFNPKSQTYNSARKEITDIIARLRTGAVINEQEEKLYKTYVPGPTDSDENARWKMEQLRKFFSGLTLSGGGSPSDPTLQDIVDTGI